MKYLPLILLMVFGCSSYKNSLLKYQGTPYKWGGIDKNGFDCSGFVKKVYQETYNINLPHNTKEIAKLGKKINKKELKKGDLVFFKTSPKYRHIGIYLGNNKFIHSSSSKGVIISNLNSKYWSKKYWQSRRYR